MARARGDFYASPFGAAYSAYMERPQLSRLVGRLLWGGDPSPYYESMAAIAAVARGDTVVDCPCGAGPAFRAISPTHPPRYVAVDRSPAMLRRARERAAARGAGRVELLAADATALPLPSDSVDLFLSFWGLHCFADPAAALVEAARVLRPGGRLLGATFVAGADTLRQRLLVRPGRGGFGRVGDEGEVRAWLRAAELDLTESSRSGPMMFFEAESYATASLNRSRPEPGR